MSCGNVFWQTGWLLLLLCAGATAQPACRQDVATHDACVAQCGAELGKTCGATGCSINDLANQFEYCQRDCWDKLGYIQGYFFDAFGPKNNRSCALCDIVAAGQYGTGLQSFMVFCSNGAGTLGCQKRMNIHPTKGRLAWTYGANYGSVCQGTECSYPDDMRGCADSFCDAASLLGYCDNCMAFMQQQLADSLYAHGKYTDTSVPSFQYMLEQSCKLRQTDTGMIVYEADPAVSSFPDPARDARCPEQPERIIAAQPNTPPNTMIVDDICPYIGGTFANDNRSITAPTTDSGRTTSASTRANRSSAPVGLNTTGLKTTSSGTNAGSSTDIHNKSTAGGATASQAALVSPMYAMLLFIVVAQLYLIMLNAA